PPEPFVDRRGERMQLHGARAGALLQREGLDGLGDRDRLRPRGEEARAARHEGLGPGDLPDDAGVIAGRLRATTRRDQPDEAGGSNEERGVTKPTRRKDPHYTRPRVSSPVWKAEARTPPSTPIARPGSASKARPRWSTRISNASPSARASTC